MACGRNVTALSRQCVIWGTTNDAVSLRDPGRNRSFRNVRCGVERGGQIDLARLMREKKQMRSQAVREHDEPRETYPTGALPMTLTGEALNIAIQMRERARINKMWEERVEELVMWSYEPVRVSQPAMEMGWKMDESELMSDGAEQGVQPIRFDRPMAAEGALGLRWRGMSKPSTATAWAAMS